MEQETKTFEKPILEKIADKLLKAQQEIDELVIQFALGKAEGKEKFEEIKKEFRQRVSEFKKLLEIVALDFLTPETRQKIEELEVQLALGKAESKELFEEQKKKIMKALLEVEAAIKPWINSTKLPDNFSHDVEKFKLKLEIIRLKFQLKKFEIKDAFKNNMADARRKIEKISTGIKQKLEAGSFKYDDFRDEMSLAYKHLKKALTDL
jgi:tRNA U34 5-methylaminomethyl-2-thiouridine-forming methyltransferase MnmC